MQLARQADREVADVDHLLNFAETFGEDFTDLDRDEAAERLLVGAQLLTEEADELPAMGRRHIAPDEKRGMRSIDGLARFECVDLGDMRDNLARYRRGYGKCAARVRKAGYAKRGEQLVDLRCQARYRRNDHDALKFRRRMLAGPLLVGILTFLVGDLQTVAGLAPDRRRRNANKPSDERVFA
jgi:hypothetical protein